MTIYDPGDIVLVCFPFTDLTATKKRPAVIVSASSYSTRHGDYLLVPLTGVEQEDLSLNEWQKAGLLKPTWAKAIIVTLAESVILKKIGQLQPVDIAAIRCMMGRIIDTIFLPENC